MGFLTLDRSNFELYLADTLKDVLEASVNKRIAQIEDIMANQVTKL